MLLLNNFLSLPSQFATFTIAALATPSFPTNRDSLIANFQKAHLVDSFFKITISTQKQPSCKKGYGPCKKKEHTNLPKFLLLKLLPLSYHHSHFWAATLDFTTFLCCLFFCMGRTLFYNLAVFV